METGRDGPHRGLIFDRAGFYTDVTTSSLCKAELKLYKLPFELAHAL